MKKRLHRVGAVVAAALLSALFRSAALASNQEQCVGGFYSNDDKLFHAVLAQRNDRIVEACFSIGGSIHKADPLHELADVVSVAAFYTDLDKHRHVIVGLGSGEVREIFYSTQGLGVSPLGSFGQGEIASVAGWVDMANGFHAAVALNNGDIRELTFGPTTSGTASWVTRYSFYGMSIRRIAGFANRNDGRIAVQFTGGNSSIAILGWAPSQTGAALIGSVGTSSFPAGCALGPALTMSAFAQGPEWGDYFLAWTNDSSVCGLQFHDPESGSLRNEPARLLHKFDRPVVAIAGYGGNLPGGRNIIAALSNGDLVLIYGSDYGSGHTTSTFPLGNYPIPLDRRVITHVPQPPLP